MSDNHRVYAMVSPMDAPRVSRLWAPPIREADTSRWRSFREGVPKYPYSGAWPRAPREPFPAAREESTATARGRSPYLAQAALRASFAEKVRAIFFSGLRPPGLQGWAGPNGEDGGTARSWRNASNWRPFRGGRDGSRLWLKGRGPGRCSIKTRKYATPEDKTLAAAGMGLMAAWTRRRALAT
jgi:hypothetical protein